MHELGIDPIEPPLEPLLDLFGVTAVQRFALASRKRAVEDVADDAARECQAVAARLALLFDDPVDDQPLDDVLNLALRFAERFQVAEFEGLAQHRGHGQDLARRLRETLDPLLDRLLNRGRKRVGRDGHLAGERP